MWLFLGKSKRTDTGFLGRGERPHAGPAALSAEPSELTELLCLHLGLDGSEYASYVNLGRDGSCGIH